MEAKEYTVIVEIPHRNVQQPNPLRWLFLVVGSSAEDAAIKMRRSPRIPSYAKVTAEERWFLSSPWDQNALDPWLNA